MQHSGSNSWQHALLQSAVQDLREKIDQHYRVRLILDNLPITTYDLEDAPESIRPGYQVTFQPRNWTLRDQNFHVAAPYASDEDVLKP